MNIVFDVGNVLVRWDAHLAFLPDFGSRAAAEAFMARIGFPALNLRADAGERFEDLSAEIADDFDRTAFAAYPRRYALAVPEAIEASWALLERLKARGHGVHAITNWSAETWPAGVAAHPRLGTAFGVTIVSGQERMLKPDPRIFALLCARAGCAAADCVFVDDSPKNVEGARAAGMEAIDFTGPGALEAALASRGML